MSAPARARFAHVPALDGLRGLSVLGPVLFHARRSALPGGFLTIDVFFVLSSYLIVSIALNEWDRTGRLDVRAYAGRRARRLLPALYVCCVVLAAHLAITVRSSDVSRWTGSIVAALAYVANWHEIWRDVGYFEQFRAPSPLYHTWSLAIEEQFYVVVPIVLILVLRAATRRGRAVLGKVVLGAGALVAALASGAWMAHLHTTGDPSRVYYGTDTRAQGLLVGIALAAFTNVWGPVRTRAGRALCIAGGWAGAAYVVAATLWQSQDTTWLFERGGFLAIAAAASLLVLGASQPSRDPWHRLLEAPPTRALGRVTYGVYLYHWPIMLLVVTPERLAAGRWWTVVAVALTVAVAALAYVVVEQPVMHRRWPVLARPAGAVQLAAAGGVLLVLVAAGLTVAHARRVDDTVRPRPIPVAPADATGASGASGATGASGTPGEAARPRRVLVIGDSLMLEIGVTLEKYAAAHPDRLVVYTHTHLGCPIVRGGEARNAEQTVARVDSDCNHWAEPAPEADVLRGVLSYPSVVETFRPDVVLGLVTPWDVTDRRLPGSTTWQHVGEPAYDALAQGEYELATRLLGATGARVLWLLGPHLDRPVVPQNDPVRIDRLNDLVRDVVTRVPNAAVVDYPGWLGPVGSAREAAFRDDGVHLTQEGLDAIVPWLLDEVLPAATRR